MLNIQGLLHRSASINLWLSVRLVVSVICIVAIPAYAAPDNWTQWVRFLLADVDDIVLTMTPDIPGLKNARAILSALNDIRPNSVPPTIVLNKVGVPKRQEISI